MIEKLVIQKLTIAGKEYEYPDTTALVGKINELVDAVNGILDYAPLEMAMKAEPKPAENVLTMVDNQVTANLPNIDAGELAFLSKENSELKDEIDILETKLERTRKALDVAVDALKWIHETYNLGMGYEAAIMEKCEFALDQITALEQKE